MANVLPCTRRRDGRTGLHLLRRSTALSVATALKLTENVNRARLA